MNMSSIQVKIKTLENMCSVQGIWIPFTKNLIQMYILLSGLSVGSPCTDILLQVKILLNQIWNLSSFIPLYEFEIKNEINHLIFLTRLTKEKSFWESIKM